MLDESSEKAWNAAAPPTPATPPRTRAPTRTSGGQAALARLGGRRLRVGLRVGLGVRRRVGLRVAGVLLVRRDRPGVLVVRADGSARRSGPALLGVCRRLGRVLTGVLGGLARGRVGVSVLLVHAPSLPVILRATFELATTAPRPREAPSIPGSSNQNSAPPSGAEPALTVPPWRSATALTMDRPEARAGLAARLGGAVEAVEDVRQVDVGDALALVADGHHALAERDRDAAARRGSTSAALSSRLVIARSSAAGVAGDPPRLGVHDELDGRRAPAHAGDGLADDGGELDRLDRRGCSGPRGRARRGRRSAWSSRGSGRARRPAAPGATRRRAWSSVSAWASRSRLVRSEVSGVRSSWPASATSWRCRACEADSAVSIALNAIGEAGHLVAALDRDRVELLGAGDLLDGGGQAAYGTQAVAGHRPARPGRRRSSRRGRRAASPGRGGRASGRSAPATGRGSAPRPVSAGTATIR